MHATNLVKVTRTGEVMGKKETTYFKEAFFQVSLLKRVVLIMQIINIIINMDNIRQERSNERPTLTSNK